MEPDHRLDEFLAAHPDIEVFEIILPDLAGGFRGKWVTRDKIHKVVEGGLKLPVSTLAFDVWGRDVGSLVFDSGAADGFRQGIAAVMASEMEFHLFEAEDDALGRPLHTQSDRVGGTLASGQTYCLETMEEQAELMHAINDACQAQRLPVDTLIKEAGPSQYEINLYHCADALLAADQAVMLQRTVRAVARQHGMRATFMAKPYGDLAGNGMHIHCSVVDADGTNLFDDGTPLGTPRLRNAIAGCLAGLPDSMLLFAPNVNSYRRFQRGSHAPLAPAWGYENRTVSVRVPTDVPAATRIEHRVAGADAHPHLVMAAVLAGIVHGIEQQLEAPEPIEGNAYEQLPDSLPRYLPDALTRFENSPFISTYLGERFQQVYSQIKHQELAEYDRQVTPLEYDAAL